MSNLNKTKYFRLRLSDSVGLREVVQWLESFEVHPEVILKSSWSPSWGPSWGNPEVILKSSWSHPEGILKSILRSILRSSWSHPAVILKSSCSHAWKYEPERWTLSALDKDGQMDRQTDRQTHTTFIPSANLEGVMTVWNMGNFFLGHPVYFQRFMGHS